MRELDRIAESEYLIDAAMLMENAGRAAVSQIFEAYPHAGKDTEFLVFAGKGNNAGDAFVVARRLLCLDRRVRIFHLVDASQYKGPTQKNFEILKRMKAKMMHLENGADLESFFRSSNGPFTIIDGILGTGLKGQLEGIFYDVVDIINKQKLSEVVALDIPSGVSGDTGAIHSASILATLTISFGFPKLGHFLPPGAARRGDLVNVDISLPPRFRKEGDQFLLMKEEMAKLLLKRDRYGHKNAFGHTLLIGGSPGKIGAISMAARACHKMGTGLVTIATWENVFEQVLSRIPDETMAVPLRFSGPDVQSYKESLPGFSAVVVGPGMGMRPEGREVIEQLLYNYNGPVVIDADGLNIVSEYGLHEMISRRQAPTVLTPHPGEMARLLGVPKSQIVDNPIGSLKECIAKTHATVMLKGAATAIGDVDDVIYLNHYPNDGMATAGTGDVLAGMIGGLVGQKMKPFQATKLAIYLHSLAGALAAEAQGHRSMTATDIIENIGNAFKDIKIKPALTFPQEGRARLL